MPRFYYMKNEPPTAIVAVANTVTSDTPDEATEFSFGLPAGVLSETVEITNTGTADISISLDGGNTYLLAITPGQSLEYAVARTSLHAKSASASQAFSVAVGVTTDEE